MTDNPVLAGFHPDPSVCRVGADYYLACSSFEYFPGIPIFHSRDLRHWRQLGNALDRPEQLRLADVPSSGGVFAPTLRHHDGQFWLATTNLWDGGHLIVTADDPAGPWSDPVTVAGVPGIDPDLAWDDDGTCYLTYAVFDTDPSDAASAAPGIQQVPIDPHTGKVLGNPRRLWSGTGLAAPEAPHLYQVGDQWYLLIAEGGTERGHAVSVARGPGPQGPFHGCPTNPVLSHRSTAAPVQNTGHADLVQATDGSWWAVVLGVRPRGGTPAYHVQGRETFLTPVDWVDGWPIPRPVRASVPRHPPVAVHRDDFDAPVLAAQWLSVRHRPAGAADLTARPGWLVLRSAGSGLDGPLPTFVGWRQQHARSRVRARVDCAAGRGGLAVRLDERHHYEIEAGDGQVRCHARIGPLRQQLAAHPIGADPVVLRIEIEPEAASFGSIGAPPDRIRLGFEPTTGSGADPVVLAELDGRYLSTEVAGGFTGRVIGMYATRGAVAVDWYEYAGSD